MGYSDVTSLCKMVEVRMRKGRSPMPPENFSGCEYFTVGHTGSDILNVHYMLVRVTRFFYPELHVDIGSLVWVLSSLILLRIVLAHKTLFHLLPVLLI